VTRDGGGAIAAFELALDDAPEGEEPMHLVTDPSRSTGASSSSACKTLWAMRCWFGYRSCLAPPRRRPSSHAQAGDHRFGVPPSVLSEEATCLVGSNPPC